MIAPEAGLRMVRADNPSAMTGTGTNTFVIGDGVVTVLDPGPDDDRHLAAILATLRHGESVGLILVTHSHLDHSALARRLATETGAPVAAYGDSYAGRSDLMQALAASGHALGGEGVDHAFRPDIALADGQQLVVADEVLTALWTPGHMGNHMCFRWRDAVFCGDHVMGWSSSLVSPPDGDLGAFMQSLHRLLHEKPRRLYPAHGAAIDDPASRIQELIAHRNMREREIIAALATGPKDIATLVTLIYTDISPALAAAAARNIFAHLIFLQERKRVAAQPLLSPNAIFSLIDHN